MRRSPAVVIATVMTTIALLPLATAPSAPAAEAGSATRVAGWGDTPTSMRAGATYLARLRVTGAARPVQLQRRSGDHWRTVRTARTTSQGRVTLAWETPTTVDQVVLRVRVPATGARRAASTAPRRVALRSSGAEPPGQGAGAHGARVLAAVLRGVNQARADGATCGGVRMPAKPALRRHAKLDRAAGDYARLMARRDHFSHTSPDGSDPGDRISAAGYPWRSYAENIAAGQTRAAQVVRAWLASEGHCRAIMGPYDEIGIGRGTDPDSRYGTYWVLDFATR